MNSRRSERSVIWGAPWPSAPARLIGDISILKDFVIHEGHRVQFRTEILNFINHANFNLPGQSRGVGGFGTISGLIGGNQARIIQLGLHYRF